MLDTGANKNILKPGIIQSLQPINSIIKNSSGCHHVSQKGFINLLGPEFPNQMYYEYDFHEFFDGIIGSQYLASSKAIINYNDETVTIAEKVIPFLKYFPSEKLFHHVVVIDTLQNGDWFVPYHQLLCEGFIVEPGLYKSDRNKSTINVLSKSRIAPQITKKFQLNVNNFETINPIPLNINEPLNKESINLLIRSSHLTPFEKDKLLDVILENQQILLKRNEKLSSTTIVKHKILTKDDEPTYTKTYRFPNHFKKDVEKQISEMLEDGVIIPSNSPYSSPIWVVPKKCDASQSRKVRVVIDFRKLNEKTINDKFPIPQIEEILDSLGKSTYFTTLDLKSGFHQIEMEPAHREKTAFSTAQGHFEFTRMPFGLKNAPATFQRAMNNVLAGYIGYICFVYLDDIIVIGNDLTSHLKNLDTVLKRLASFNLKIQIDKCEFLKRETEFLGHLITQHGIKPNPDKIKKILDWKLPSNQHEIKRFLGLAGYYRKFVKDYAKITRPLSKCLKKGAKVLCEEDGFKKAFEELKKIIASDQVLAYPDFEHPFILTTDASNFALGAVLSQIQDNCERPIAFASRTLTSTESNYPATEKEALAIIWAVKKYKPYLYGQKFTLITDHKPLTFIKTSFKNSKILNWRLELENFDFDVKYKEGKANVVADALSRIKPQLCKEINTSSISDTPDGTDAGSNNTCATIHSASRSKDYFVHYTERPVNYYRNQLIFKTSSTCSITKQNPFVNFQRAIVSQNTYNTDNISEYLATFHNGKQTAIFADENIILILQEVFSSYNFTKGHFVVTTTMVEDVTEIDKQNFLITKEHDRAHRGISEVENQLRRSYYFPCMLKMIRSYINSCEICNCNKYERKPYNIKISPRPITNKPLDRVHMDIYIINSCSFLSIIDSFTKHLQMLFIKNKNLVQVQRKLTKYFSIFGLPKEIVTDHETTFMSIQLKNYLASLGVLLKYASCSESNGQIEKTHCTITEIINSNKYKYARVDTKALTRLAVTLYNNTVHSATKFTPNELLFNNTDNSTPDGISNKAIELFCKAKQNMLKASNRQLAGNYAKCSPPWLNENQEVFITPNIRTKMQPRATKIVAKNIKKKTFENARGVKRHKSKIKRIRC